MPAKIGVAGCKTLAVELKRCCEELGLPTEHYSSRPCCMFGEQREQLCDMVACAAAENDDVLLAFGGGCADVEALRAGVKGASLTAHRCTEMLVGAGTYGWCVGQGVLLLPPTWLDEYLQDAETREPLEQLLKAQVDSSGAKQLGAIQEAGRAASVDDLAEVEGFADRPATPIFSGLGHLREALRAAAVSAGIRIAQSDRAPISIDAIGPGDQLLLLDEDGPEGSSQAATLASTLLARDTACVWITGNESPDAVATKMAAVCPDVDALRDSGQLRILTAEEALAGAGAAADPRQLARRWITLSLQALADSGGGLCVIHGNGWAGSAGLDVDYVLEYTARLSSACARWPLVTASEIAVDAAPDSVLGELARTHPLIWTGGHVVAGARFDGDYLGGEDVLDTMGATSQALDCQTIAPLISALADGELNGNGQKRLDEHATTCPRCQALIDCSRNTKTALSGLHQPPPEAAKEIWGKVAEEIKSSSE